jgi:hypothetical protein
LDSGRTTGKSIGKVKELGETDSEEEDMVFRFLSFWICDLRMKV